MTNKQSEVVKEVLSRLTYAGVLDGLVLVGSWCLLLYRQYFGDDQYLPAIRTRDMDFLVPLPPQFTEKVDVPELLQELGFVLGHRGDEGYMILQHPELLVEFLTPERGRGHEGPYDLPKLGMNAQSLRYMDFALSRTLTLTYDDIPVTVPHPAAFALHKLLVAPRRKNKERRSRDAETGVLVLKAVVANGDAPLVQELLEEIPASWQKTIRRVLKDAGQESILADLD